MVFTYGFVGEEDQFTVISVESISYDPPPTNHTSRRKGIMKENYQKLIDELRELYQLANAGEFSDFDNTMFATPKMELVKRLENIKQNAMKGEYDD